MLEQVGKVEFNNYTNDFLRKLAKDTKDIDKETKMLVPADKMTNLKQPNNLNV